MWQTYQKFFVIPGIAYSFENQNLITFEESSYYKYDLPFVAYSDFETSATANGYINVGDDEIHPVSYVSTFAFHPDLNLDRVIFQRSFGHSLNQLYDIFYLSRDILSLINPITNQQLTDVAIKISKWNVKQTIPEMFSAKLRFVVDRLLAYFEKVNKKIPYREKYKMKKSSIDKIKWKTA